MMIILLYSAFRSGQKRNTHPMLMDRVIFCLLILQATFYLNSRSIN